MRAVVVKWNRVSLTMVIALVWVLVPVQPAFALDGVWHDPHGIDELYTVEPTERAPRDPMAGDTVFINATTWPIESGQTVWVTWTKNGVSQTPVGAAWQYNSGNNSYWQVNLGSFARGDQITYTVHADVNGTGEKTVGPFSFAVTSWSTVTDVTGYVDNGSSVDVIAGDSAGDFTPRIRYSFPTSDSFRAEISPTGSGLTSSGITGYTVTDSPATLEIATTDLVLKIQKSPYRLSVFKGDGTTLITRQYDPAVFRNIGWASDGATTVTKIEDHLLSPAEERFEAFGERYDYLNQRGQDVHNYVYNQYRDQGTTHRTYLSVPFFLNSAGYGVYIPSTRYSIFNLATHLSDMAGFTVSTDGSLASTADYYMFTGSPEEVVSDYTAVSGRPQLPPKWAFGLWASANEWNTQVEVEAELANIDTYDIPHSVIVLEQWSDEATFYIWHGADYTPTTGAGSFSYADFTFPTGTAWSDPRAMVTDAHTRGLKVLLWQIPVLKENFDTNPATAPQQHLNDKSYAASQGYVVDDGTGNPYRIPSGQWFGDSMVPDFTNSLASNWWMSKRNYLMREVGVDGFKTDGGEAIFGRDVTFGDGRTGDEMHNAYPNTYTSAYNAYVQSETAGNGTIFSRAGTSGAQTNSIFWSGDQDSSFAAFQEAVRAGISAGQSGIPFWAWDMAGFTGGFPSSELYLRSAAQATFSPIMQYHSEKASPSPSEARTPWNVQARTGDTSVIPTFRKFANVRMNLIPYLYTEAKVSADTGVPMMRAMSLAYPQESAAATLDQQYMFGSQLLVAPITAEGATTKSVYLPAGEWYDLWYGKRVTGGQFENVYAGLDTIPVFARAGAIIPLNLSAGYEFGGNISNDVNTYANLVFRIYPEGNSSYDYFDDASGVHRTIGSTANWTAGTVDVTVPALSTTSTLQLATTEPGSVTLDGLAMVRRNSLNDLVAAADGWYWDADEQLTYVKLASSPFGRSVGLAGVAKTEVSIPRVQFTSGSNYLVVELLDDDLVHFELSPNGPGPGPNAAVFATPQVEKVDYTGPLSYVQDGTTLTTGELRVEVNGANLCVDVYHTVPSPDVLLHQACPRNMTQDWKGLSLTKQAMENAYGLGSQFFLGGSSDGDWVGRTRTPGDNFGNAMIFDVDNGPVSNTQVPVLFAVGPASASYGIFVDQVYKQEWNLTGDPWLVDTWGDQLRWYVMAGPDLPDVRSDYLELTGRPPVPPKKAFGLWMSEFAYDNWAEVDATLADLRTAGFPVDGFMLDLEWFGGVTAGSDSTAMGSLTWDTVDFPNPVSKVGSLASDGVGIALIEESYIGKALPEHLDMTSRGYLVRDGCATCDPVYLIQNDWWGRGGMIDWTQDSAGAYWHDTKRQTLVDGGVIGHWLDLGEPEMYLSSDWTAGVLPGKHGHADYHNLYNLEWAESIVAGYTANGVNQRPFLLTRSGAGGIQRYGAALWSGDIGSKLTALAAQQNVQMHMSMSGIDYYGSDIGGFRREMLDSDLNELYTQWFANGAWFDIPLRPHTENLCDCNETSPALIGNTASNLANLRQRYELTPYYYSLAHRAYLYGEPVVPPLVYHFQNDPTVREIGHEKMIGGDLLVGVVAGAGERQRNVYLPAGSWVNYHTNEWLHSSGQWYTNHPEYVNGVFRLPVFARAGAILPKMFVDDATKNVFGERTDATTRDELIVRVVADVTPSSFTLYEDDGQTTGYQTGDVRTTVIDQNLTGSTATVVIRPAAGMFTGATASRANVVELVVENTQASAVSLNGTALVQHPDKATFDATVAGWYNAGGNLIVAKSGSLGVEVTKTFEFTLGQAPVSVDFVCQNGTTTTGQSVYVVGNVPQLGEWSPASAVKLDPTAYPTWTGTISNLPPNTSIEWKCIKRQDANYPDTADAWQPGGNNVISTPATGSAGTSTGSF